MKKQVVKVLMCLVAFSAISSGVAQAAPGELVNASNKEGAVNCGIAMRATKTIASERRSSVPASQTRAVGRKAASSAR